MSCMVDPQVLGFDSAQVLPPRPPGRALGTFLGLQLGMGLQRADVRLAFDPTLGRSVPMAYAGTLLGLSCSCMRHSSSPVWRSGARPGALIACLLCAPQSSAGAML